MTRTQIYLSDEERRHLKRLSAQTGRKQSELIRQAVDAMIFSGRREARASALEAGRGLWAGREDLPDFGRLRRGWDRAR